MTARRTRTGKAKASADPPSYEAVRTATALYVRYSNGQQEYYNTATRPVRAGQHRSPAGIPAWTLSQALTAMENCHTAATCWAAGHLSSPLYSRNRVWLKPSVASRQRSSTFPYIVPA